MTSTAPPTTGTPVAGIAWGLVGVLAFSFTVIATRVAVVDLDPLLVGTGRAVVAAALAGVALAWTRQRLPSRRQWLRLGIVATGVVAGFPLLTSYALTTTPASHGAVVIALLPAATAVAATVRAHERPSARFWVASAAGCVAAVTTALVAGGGPPALHGADLLLLLAVVAAAVGYAEGGVLARELGAWQTIAWALVVASPVMAALAGSSLLVAPAVASPQAWLAFAYLSVVSMLLGFVAWYRGLAIGPMARVSQLQLVQPTLSIAWAALLLGEVITVPTIVGGAVVVACAAVAVRSRASR
ncbi:DMT family transporter [Agrococcus jejuensis]|nr:DMT family transporter [Agrococcus jejuensis]